MNPSDAKAAAGGGVSFGGSSSSGGVSFGAEEVEIIAMDLEPASLAVCELVSQLRSWSRGSEAAAGGGGELRRRQMAAE